MYPETDYLLIEGAMEQGNAFWVIWGSQEDKWRYILVLLKHKNAEIASFLCDIKCYQCASAAIGLIRILWVCLARAWSLQTLIHM